MIENETQTIRISLALVQVDGPPLDSGSWRLSDPFRIGRAASNELELPDPGVSRRHASVERANDGWIVRDCGSRQGIELNGLALAESATARLRAGDILRVGPWQFRIDALADEHGGPGSANAPTRISVVRAVGNLAEQRLELLLQYAGDIAAARDEAALAEILAEHALLGSGYARATVLWCREGDIIVCCQRPAPSPRSQWQFNAALVASAGNGDLARLESDTPPSGGQASLQRKPRRAMCVPIMLALSVVLSAILFDRPVGWRFYRTVLFVPYILSIPTVGFVFGYIFQFRVRNFYFFENIFECGILFFPT